MFEQKEINTRYGNMLIFTEDPTIGKALDLYGEYCHSEIELIKNYTDKGAPFGGAEGNHTRGMEKTQTVGNPNRSRFTRY